MGTRTTRWGSTPHDALGAVLGTAALIGLSVRLATTQPLSLVAITGIVAFALVGQLVKRSRRRKGIETQGCSDDDAGQA